MALKMSEVVGGLTYLQKLHLDANLRKFNNGYESKWEEGCFCEDLMFRFGDIDMTIWNFVSNTYVVEIDWEEPFEVGRDWDNYVKKTPTINGHDFTYGGPQMTTEQVDKMLNLVKETKQDLADWSERLRKIFEQVLPQKVRK